AATRSTPADRRAACGRPAAPSPRRAPRRAPWTGRRWRRPGRSPRAARRGRAAAPSPPPARREAQGPVEDAEVDVAAAVEGERQRRQRGHAPERAAVERLQPLLAE